MNCLRCGTCCIKYCVVIVDDPDLGISESNLISRTGLEGPCKHLRGSGPGKYSCAVHDRNWYSDTPCFQFTQVEGSTDTPCRIGMAVLGLDPSISRDLYERYTNYHAEVLEVPQA